MTYFLSAITVLICICRIAIVQNNFCSGIRLSIQIGFIKMAANMAVKILSRIYLSSDFRYEDK